MKLILMLRLSKIMLFAILFFIQILSLIWQGDLFDLLPFLIISLIIWFVSRSRHFRFKEDYSDFMLLFSFYFALTVVFLGSTERLVYPNSSVAYALGLLCKILIVLTSIDYVFRSIELKSYSPVIKMSAVFLLSLFFYLVPAIEATSFIPRQIYAKYIYDVDISKVIIAKYSRDAVVCNQDSTTTYFHKPFYGYFYTEEEYIPGFGVCNPSVILVFVSSTFSDLNPERDPLQ